MEETSKPTVGKPWKNESFHKTYEEANKIRNKLMSIWESNESHKGMQVKVKYMPSRDSFVVKTRLHPDYEPVKKKNVKRKNKNRTNNSERKLND